MKSGLKNCCCPTSSGGTIEKKVVFRNRFTELETASNIIKYGGL